MALGAFLISTQRPSLLAAVGLSRQGFGKGPELPNGHIKIVTDCRHDIACDVRVPALDLAQIVVAVSQRGSQGGL